MSIDSTSTARRSNPRASTCRALLDPPRAAILERMRIALGSLLFALAMVSSAGPARAEVVVVRQLGFYFSPREVVVRAGDTVRWVWTGGTHTVSEGTDGVVDGDELFHSSLSSGTTAYEFTFTPAILAANPRPDGRYDYFCAPHAAIGMNGAVIVADPEPGSALCFGDGTGAACPCGNTASQPIGCLNSILQGGRLRGRGNASVASDTLELWMSGLPEGADLLVFQGSAAVNGGAGAAFGDGLRCAGGSVVRLARTSIGFGWARTPGPSETPLSVRGFVTPGTTRVYQARYLDGPSPCTGSLEANYSNAYVVTWQ